MKAFVLACVVLLCCVSGEAKAQWGYNPNQQGFTWGQYPNGVSYNYSNFSGVSRYWDSTGANSLSVNLNPITYPQQSFYPVWPTYQPAQQNFYFRGYGNGYGYGRR